MLRRYFSVLVLFLLASTAAWATKITVGDPATPVSVTPITDADIPFQVTFGSCAGLTGFTGNMGCYAFYNDSSADWSSISLTLTSGMPSNGYFTCASDTFSTLNCRNPQELLYNDCSIPNTNPLQTFVIAEDDLPPGDLTFSANVTFASATPEPSSIVLLGTGLCGACALLWHRRRIGA